MTAPRSRDGEAPAAADIEPPASTAACASGPLAVIGSLLGRRIAFHRRLVDLTANVKAALLLSQSLYWTRHGCGITENDGWFFKTTQQWELETGLSAKEQATARDLLRRQSLVEEQRKGIPARLYFRLSLEELRARLSARITRRQEGQDWSDTIMLTELLGPSLAYHRSLAGIAGGVHAGLMLSRALHLTRLQSKRRRDAWIGNSTVRWSAAIGLSCREQTTARRDLTRSGLWEETLQGIPPSLMARIRLDCLLSLLIDTSTAGYATGQPVAPVVGDAADWVAPKGKSRLRRSHRLVSPKAPNLICRNRHHSFAESAILLINTSTSDLVQPLHTAHDSPRSTSTSRGGELIFPEQLLPEERTAAGHLLRHCGEHAQVLLDELAGRLHVRGVRSSPLAYLRGLIVRAAVGSFVPELAFRVAAQRRQREDEARECHARAAHEERLAAERAAPAYQVTTQARRDNIKQLIDGLQRRLRTEKPS